MSWHSRDGGSSDGADEPSSKVDHTLSPEGQLAVMMAAAQRDSANAKKTAQVVPTIQVPVSDVFASVQHNRHSILEWAKSCESIELGRVLELIAGVVLRRAACAPLSLVGNKTLPDADVVVEAKHAPSMGWRQVSSEPLICEETIETEHPYAPDTDQCVAHIILAPSYWLILHMNHCSSLDNTQVLDRQISRCAAAVHFI